MLASGRCRLFIHEVLKYHGSFIIHNASLTSSVCACVSMCTNTKYAQVRSREFNFIAHALLYNGTLFVIWNHIHLATGTLSIACYLTHSKQKHSNPILIPRPLPSFCYLQYENPGGEPGNEATQIAPYDYKLILPQQ